MHLDVCSWHGQGLWKQDAEGWSSALDLHCQGKSVAFGRQAQTQNLSCRIWVVVALQGEFQFFSEWWGKGLVQGEVTGQSSHQAQRVVADVLLSTFFPSVLSLEPGGGAELCVVPPGLLSHSQTNREGALNSLNPSCQLLLAGAGIPLSGVMSSCVSLVQVPFPQARVCRPHPGWGECSGCGSEQESPKTWWWFHFCVSEAPSETGSGIPRCSRILCLSSPLCSRLVMPSSGRVLHPAETFVLIWKMKMWEHTALQNLRGPHVFEIGVSFKKLCWDWNRYWFVLLRMLF